MSLILTNGWMLYALIVVGAVFILFGFYAIKPLASLVGFLIGYLFALRYLPLESPVLNTVAVLAGLIVAAFFFTAHLTLPFLIGSAFTYCISFAFVLYYSFPAEVYHYILFISLSLLIGLTTFVAKDYFIIIWTSLFGAVLLTFCCCLLFNPGTEAFVFDKPVPVFSRLIDMAEQNGSAMLIALLSLFCVGLLVQFFMTSSAQVFIRKRYIGKHRK